MLPAALGSRAHGGGRLPYTDLGEWLLRGSVLAERGLCGHVCLCVLEWEGGEAVPKGNTPYSEVFTFFFLLTFKLGVLTILTVLPFWTAAPLRVGKGRGEMRRRKLHAAISKY